MNREQIISYIQTAVKESEPESWHTKSENGKDIVDRTYKATRPNSTRTTKSAMRIKILSGDYFSEQISFFLELLDQCGLEVSEK